MPNSVELTSAGPLDRWVIYNDVAAFVFFHVFCFSRKRQKKKRLEQFSRCIRQTTPCHPPRKLILRVYVYYRIIFKSRSPQPPSPVQPLYIKCPAKSFFLIDFKMVRDGQQFQQTTMKFGVGKIEWRHYFLSSATTSHRKHFFDIIQKPKKVINF